MASCSNCVYLWRQLNEEPCNTCTLKDGCFTRYTPKPTVEPIKKADCKTCLYRYFSADDEPCIGCYFEDGHFTKYKPKPPTEWSDDTYYEIIEAVDSRLLDEMDKVKPDGTRGSILSPGLMVASGIIQELHLRRTKHD